MFIIDCIFKHKENLKEKEKLLGNDRATQIAAKLVPDQLWIRNPLEIIEIVVGSVGSRAIVLK